MFIDFLKERFEKYACEPAIIWNGGTYDYNWLLSAVGRWRDRLARLEVAPQTVCALEGDFSPNSIALFLALIEAGAVVVPLTSAGSTRHQEYLAISQAELILNLDTDDNWQWKRTTAAPNHETYLRLKRLRHPGLVLFSSGSAGKSKGVVHDLVPLMKKFETGRQAWRTIAFLLYDHIGGVNTMLHTLANGGCMVTVQGRSPEEVLASIARHRVELLPTSPTFLNLILISEAWRYHDLSSLRLVTYGTEPMPVSTLTRFRDLFPNLKLQQTYGLSELGILRCKSRSSDSLWVKIGGEGYQTRIVDGILQIKAESAMLGYLNAPNPFTDDGWFDTQDRVEEDGEYIRILGRNSEIINVGGEKVYPNEVESVIQEVENVAEVVVFRERNPITGNIVCARVTTITPEDQLTVALRVKKHCASRLQRFKVPARVLLADGPQHNARFKRVR